MSCKHLFLDVYDDYLSYARKKQKNQSYTTLKYKCDKHILPYFKDIYLEDITCKTIIDWEEYIMSLNYSNNHNRNLYYILSGIFEYCSLFYNFDKSIITKVGSFKKKYEDNKYDFYNLKEFQQFISGFDDEIYKQFFNLLFFTGVRPGEAMALQFKDLNNGYITICKTMENHGNRTITTPKTKSSNRIIQIDYSLNRDLLNLKHIYEKQCTFSPDLFIFGGLKPLSPTTINRKKIKACEKANIRPITLHQFRHSHATFLIQHGIMINEVSRRLGHSKTSTTLDIYSHTDLTQEKRVINTLNSSRLHSATTLKYKLDFILKRLFALISKNWSR